MSTPPRSDRPPRDELTSGGAAPSLARTDRAVRSGRVRSRDAAGPTRKEATLASDLIRLDDPADKDHRLTPALTRGLTTELSRQLREADGGLAEATGIRRLLDRCDAAGRRREVEQLVSEADKLTGSARRDFATALHPVQVRSKLWLIDELARRRELATSSLVVLGGWYGVLPLLINWRLATPPRQMVCIDIDDSVCEIGARLIGALYANIEHRCADLTELDYTELAERPGTVVINTSCEHVPGLVDWWGRVPRGQLVVLQSNNYEGCPDHVNCVHDLDQFKHQTPMSDLLFEGVLHVADDLDRFMLIGHR